MDSIKEMIEKRAYHLFLKRGGVHGYSVQDWFQAEKEIFAEIEAKKAAEAGQSARPAKAEVPSSTPAPAPAAAAAPAPAAKPKATGAKKGKTPAKRQIANH